jgi:hypothetical protein
MSKISVNTFKHKFFYQIVILSLIVISVFVAVSITSNTSKKFFSKSKAAGVPTCNSWTDFYIHGTGGNCTPFSSYSNNLPVCNTTSQTVTLNLNGVANATQMQLINVDPSWYCTDNRIVWPYLQPYIPNYSGWKLIDGFGERKVCGRFTNNQGEVKCGGMVYTVANNTPTSTPRPPTPTPTRIPPTSTPVPPPCTRCEYSGYRCDGKNAYRCIDRCLIYQGACSPDKSCNADTTHWWCTDNCPDGSYRCTTQGGYEFLQKCTDDKWINLNRCDLPGDECGCRISPPGCVGICGGD